MELYVSLLTVCAIFYVSLFFLSRVRNTRHLNEIDELIHEVSTNTIPAIKDELSDHSEQIKELTKSLRNQAQQTEDDLEHVTNNLRRASENLKSYTEELRQNDRSENPEIWANYLIDAAKSYFDESEKPDL